MKAMMLVPVLAVAVGVAAGRAEVTSFYELKTTTLAGKPADLKDYTGKVALVVNVASKCGYTPQYEGLEKLQREMKGQGFNVLGFPSNDFGGQEPGTAQEIATFCKLTYRRDLSDVREGCDQERYGSVADLHLPGRFREATCMELQQVRRGQTGQGCCFL